MKPATFQELMDHRSDVKPDKCIACGGTFTTGPGTSKEFFNHKEMKHLTWCRRCTDKWLPYAKARIAEGLNPCPAMQLMVEARRGGRI